MAIWKIVLGLVVAMGIVLSQINVTRDSHTCGLLPYWAGVCSLEPL